jgi:hypothetical protein
MKLTEWLQSKGQNKQATFIICQSVKYDNTDFYHKEYRTTPIHCVWEWLEGDIGERYIVINADHPPVDIAGHWVNQYKRGDLLCAIITTEADLYRETSEEQAKRMIAYYDTQVKKQMQEI